MRKLVYIVENAYGIEIFGTSSYKLAEATKKNGCSYKTALINFSEPLTKKEKEWRARRFEKMAGRGI